MYDDAPKLKPATNADRIRAMTDEEMAHTINDYFMGCPPVDCEDGGCEQCWLGWLKQEAK